jgi:hypothetical protein
MHPRSLHLEFEELTREERELAAQMITDLHQRVSFERVLAIIRAIDRGEPAIPLHSAQRELPLTSNSLLRNERALGVAMALALNLACGEESARRIFAALASRANAYKARGFAVLDPEVKEIAHEAIERGWAQAVTN